MATFHLPIGIVDTHLMPGLLLHNRLLSMEPLTRINGRLDTNRRHTIRPSTLTRFNSNNNNKEVFIRRLLLSTHSLTAFRRMASDRDRVHSLNRSRSAVSVLIWRHLIHHPDRVNRWTDVVEAFHHISMAKTEVSWMEVHSPVQVHVRHRPTIRPVEEEEEKTFATAEVIP